jgi:hypothetical protein
MLGFLNRRFLIIGLLVTWIVGMGRYWDDPGAHLLQHLGVGSLIYVFVMALIIWLVVHPYGNPEWRYGHVLTFVTLTSFPAIFYAIPVELYFDVDTSATMNAWFLAVVAAWRMALLFFFLRRFANLTRFATVVTALLPVCLIIVALTFLNLERAVFNIMGGIREKTSKDTAYKILVLLTVLSFYGAIPLLIAYTVAIVKKAKSLKRADKQTLQAVEKATAESGE